MDDLTLVREPIASQAARNLIAGLNLELLELYPEDDAVHFRVDPAELGPGRGVFLVAYRKGRAVGCGAVRRLNDRDAAIEGMYVTPFARGRGIGKAILAALEAEARALGATRLVLETGERQPDALALYAAAGFGRIEPFGEYAGSPLSVCMAKEL